MNFKELKEAFITECPVMYRGAKYSRIERISFQKDKDKRIVVTATLRDVCGHSEVTVIGEEVQPCTT